MGNNNSNSNSDISRKGVRNREATVTLLDELVQFVAEENVLLPVIHKEQGNVRRVVLVLRRQQHSGQLEERGNSRPAGNQNQRASTGGTPWTIRGTVAAP